MRLVSFHFEGKDTYGAIADGGVVDLGARLGAKVPRPEVAARWRRARRGAGRREGCRRRREDG